MQIIQLKYRSKDNLNTNLEYLKAENTSAPEPKVIKERERNNFKFPIRAEDTLFILTGSRVMREEGINNLTSKMITIKELKYINMLELSKALAAMGIETLLIFSIYNDYVSNTSDAVSCNIGSQITYYDISADRFINLIKSKADFLEYNQHSLYIIRNGHFLDIKNMFASVSGYNVNIGRGGSQKAHILSPLDLRLSSYIMALFKNKYKLISYLNTFNELSKDRYLSYTNKYNKPYKQVTITNKHLFLGFKPIVVAEIPLYKGDPDKFLDCSDTTCPNLLINKDN